MEDRLETLKRVQALLRAANGSAITGPRRERGWNELNEPLIDWS